MVLAPALLTALSQHRDDIYEIPATQPTFGAEPAPVAAGDTADGKWLYYTSDPLPANQPLLFRWHHPDSRAGFPLTYVFMIGQYALRIKDVIVEVFRDTSAGGDRTAWKLVQRCPLWSLRDLNHAVGDTMPAWSMSDTPAHDRHLLWFPYRRHQVLLQANTRQWALLTVKPVANRLPDDSDWDIVRADTLAVWVMTPAPGRLQVQKIAYTTSAIHVQTPTTQLDYTPGVAPSFTLSKDSDNGTTLSVTQSEPPSYTLPASDAKDCALPTTSPDDQTRTYGGELLFQSADGRHTPFLYGLALEAGRTFGTRATTPFTVTATSGATYHLDEVTITLGLRPGEGRMTAKLTDGTPAFALAPYYYRSAMPITLNSGATVVFNGWTEPNEVQPLKASGTPRRLTFSAVDRWKQLTRTYLRDQRDWSQPGPGGIEYGHIEVVLFLMQQGGVDTTSAVTPPYTSGVAGTYNTPLSLGGSTIDQTSKTAEGQWKAQKHHTVADFIQKIGKYFSAWDVGFYSDGRPFYLPYDYYTTTAGSPTATTFAAAHSGTAPYFRNAQWRTIEPEANVIVVFGHDPKTMAPNSSARWVDWGSVLNPNTVNYLGRFQTEVIQLPGGYTCQQLNYIARKVWDKTRRRRYTIEFDAEHVVGLECGHVCTVGSYGDYRIRSINATFTHGTVTHARYTGELVESGVGT